MNKVKIYTDSGCDLDLEYLKELKVNLIPLTVNFENQIFEDRVSITTKDFYERLKKTNDVPKTSQITPAIFTSKFEEALRDGSYVIYISLSSGLSGTYQSACISKEMLGSDKLFIVDSKGASVGFGLLVREAALMAMNGKPAEEIVERVVFMRDRMEYIFAVGSLEMLKRGGRISSAQAVIGTLLNVKPMLQFEDGKIVPFDKVRGDKGIIKKMIDTMKERGHDIENQVIGLNFAADTRLCMTLKEEIEKNFNVKEFIISEIGSVIGSHVGEGTVSVFFMRK